MILPTKIHAVAAKHEKENLRFRRFLKAHADADELDRQFMALHHELFAEYDCCHCGNCCRAYSTTLQDEEIESIAASKSISLTELAVRKLKLHAVSSAKMENARFRSASRRNAGAFLIPTGRKGCTVSSTRYPLQKNAPLFLRFLSG